MLSVKVLQNILRPLIAEAVEDALTRDSKNIERYLRRQALESSAAFVLQEMKDARPLESKWAVLECGLEAARPFLEEVPDALICEFGVFSGETINFLAKRLSDKTIYGFDSFEGLPEAWRDGFPEGAFKRTTLPMVEENVKLVQGYFDDSLVPFLGDYSSPAALLHVDCDLFSSTKTIFDTFADRIIPGTVVVFDEYFNYPGWEEGEHKAFQLYLRATGRKAKWLGYCKFHQQVAVLITD